MSDKNDYQNYLNEIKSLPDEKIKTPHIPVKVMISEAENLYFRADKDFEDLKAANMPAEWTSRLLGLTRAMRVAESNWSTINDDKDLAHKEWKDESSKMYNLVSDIIDHMEFGYRNNPELIAKLDKIKEGNSNADSIQDLSDLAVLGKNNPQPLIDIGFDITKCDLAETEADRFGTLLGRVNGDMYVSSEVKLLRDKTFTLLEEVVGNIRDYGRFVYRNNSKRRKAYTSKYFRDSNKQYRRNGEKTE